MGEASWYEWDRAAADDDGEGWYVVRISDTVERREYEHEVYSLDANGAFLSALHHLGGLTKRGYGYNKFSPHGRIARREYLPSKANNFCPRYRLLVARAVVATTDDEMRAAQ
jgi:hypothetical protein